MRPVWLTVAIVVTLSLVACRDEEQGRILKYNKGVYSGEPMPVIEKETREDLRTRAHHQNF